MNRMVAVFLWTLKGCPVRMMRLAMMRLVSALRKDPCATRIGAGQRKRIGRVSACRKPCSVVYTETHPEGPRSP